MAKACVIDGNSLLFRAYYATAAKEQGELMRTRSGIPTNAVYAFSNMLNKILSTLRQGDYLFVAFDTGQKTFRHEEDKDYKANRKPAPPELKEQMPIAREMLRALDVFTFEKEGYEADDLCGTIAKRLGKEGIKVTLYTSDHDFLQLIDENIKVCLLKTGLSKMEILDEEGMLRTYGYLPTQITDYKGLRGDVSDNLKGIPGIGEKTAVRLLQEYDDLESIIAAAKTMKGKIGEKILTYQESGRTCKHLATILTDVDVPFSTEALCWEGYSFKTASAFANKYELKQFLTRLPASYKISEEKDDFVFETLSSFKGITIPQKIGIAIDQEPGNYHDATIHGLALSTGEKHYYITLQDLIKDESIKNILKDESIEKYCHDGKAIKVALHDHRVILNGIVFDLLLAAYLIDSSLRNSLTATMHYFGLDLGEQSGAELSLFDNSDAKKTAKVAFFCLKESERVRSELSRLACLDLYDEVERPLSDVLAEMEIEGMPLDVELLKKIGASFKEEKKKAEEAIVRLVGHPFNVDSPKQVAEVLYDELGFKPGRKNSTASDVLKDLARHHPIAGSILDYRKYAKLLSTYVEGLSAHVHKDGRLHALFNQAQTATGRLSMSEPNLQNITINDEEGKKIRQAFVYPDDEHLFLSLDYSQIELRILASLADSKALQDVFLAGEDVHAATAKRLFGKDQPTPAERRRAKAVNFGIIYGISDWGLAEEIDTTPKEARKIIENFYAAYPEIATYFQGVIEGLQKNGYVTTLFKRRRYLREVHDANYQVREFARRAAMNAPIQGTAADLIKIAMIKVARALKERKLRSRLILQIHDELLLKVPKEEKEIVLPLVRKIMEEAIDLPVPLQVSGGYGRTWYDAK